MFAVDRRLRRLPRFSGIFAAVLPLLLLGACKPQRILEPSRAVEPAIAVAEVRSALAASGVNCQVVKETFLACQTVSSKVIIGATATPSGPTLFLAAAWKQPACEDASFRARIQAYNAEYVFTTARCEDGMLLITHQSHLFTDGLEAADVASMVDFFSRVASGSANEAHLLDAPGATSGTKPKKDAAKDDPAGGKM